MAGYVNLSYAQARDGYRGANWECDVETVLLEQCTEQEDPLGYRAVYVRAAGSVTEGDGRYSIGASHLQSRLDKLVRSGFEAPMTEKALNMIDGLRLKRVRRFISERD